MKLSYRAAALLSILILIIVGGTVFFHYVESWSWVDSYFFTVVTLSTVGYGDLVPATVIGRIGTTVLIFLGIGVFAVAIQQFGSFAVHRREEKMIARRGDPKANAQPDDINPGEHTDP